MPATHLARTKNREFGPGQINFVLAKTKNLDFGPSENRFGFNGVFFLYLCEV